MSSRLPGSNRPAGFSLVELLVAVALFGVIAVILLTVTDSVSSLWQRGIAHNERRRSAMMAFQKITRDLRQAALPSDSDSADLKMLLNPTALSSGYLSPQAAFWQAPAATDKTRGDLAVVGYFVQWVDSTPKLCRFLANPSSAGSYLLYTTPNEWISSALLASEAPATRASGYAGELSENVLGLWMQPLDRLQVPITRTASNSAFAPGRFDSSQGYTSSEGTIYRNALPAAMEVVLVTVDNRTAGKLSGTEKPGARTADLWADVRSFYDSLPPSIRKGAEIHSTVVSLANAPR